MLLASAFSKLKLKYMLVHEVMILELKMLMLDVVPNFIFKNKGESQIFLLCSFVHKKDP